MDKREAQRAKLKVCLCHLTTIASNRTGRLYRISPKAKSSYAQETQSIINEEMDKIINCLIPIDNRSERAETEIPVLTS